MRWDGTREKEIDGFDGWGGEATSKTSAEQENGAGVDDECLNEGGKGHHTRTPRPNLDLDWT